MKTYNVVEKRAPDPGRDKRSAFEALQRVIDAAVPWHRGGLSTVEAAERALTRQPGKWRADQYAAYSGSTLTVAKLAQQLAERIPQRPSGATDLRAEGADREERPGADPGVAEDAGRGSRGAGS